MKEFLSEENIEFHSEYVRMKRLKYSIFESSFPKLSDAKFTDIIQSKLSRCDKQEALELLSDISIHDVYFSSYSTCKFAHSSIVSELYGSEARLLNEIYECGMRLQHGFVSVYFQRGRIVVRSFVDPIDAMRFATPILAIDVCEHAYFLDYGFDKERYLIASLPYLNIAKFSTQTT